MDMDDFVPKRTDDALSALAKQDLDPLSVDELHARVALLEADGKPIANCTLEDSEPLQTNATRWQASWRSKAQPPTDRPVRVVLSLNQARLFSLSCGTSLN